MVTEERREKIERVIAGRLKGLACVCENFEKPHNAAAILRTCEALGILNVYIIEEDFPFEPAKGVTQGAEKWLFLHRFRRAERAIAALKEAGYAIYAAVPGEGSLALEQLPCERPLALAFGAEATGLSEKLLSACEGTFKIPMWGFSQSLNVSVAAGVALYHCAQARRRRLGREGDLSQEELSALRARYLELSLPPSRRPKA
ncbi:MAG: rRNA methylase SpoU [Acetothermia bacterium 64_32]|nr:MAG: rRNA methylase SpoU [Acetothermia bacterium 64_32]HAF71448.1 TrmH family RNA methyltransferase [Candidatus Acetothermia bacterium]